MQENTAHSPELEAVGSPCADETDGSGLTTLEKRLAVRKRPHGKAVMYQSWQELLFLHWKVDAEAVRATLPEGLAVDTFDGHGWVGIVPFFMRNVRPWWSPCVPGLSNFQELNCRTYVVAPDGTPGVWFYSLDANLRLAVWGARTFYHLPYEHARMSYDWNPRTGRVGYRSHRRGAPESFATEFVYEPQGASATSAPGTLEFFLLERYVLFSDFGNGRLMSGRVHHPPYEFCAANVEAFDEALLALNGFDRTGRPPDHAVISRGVDVEIFPLQRISSGAEGSG